MFRYILSSDKILTNILNKKLIFSIRYYRLIGDMYYFFHPHSKETLEKMERERNNKIIKNTIDYKEINENPTHIIEKIIKQEKKLITIILESENISKDDLNILKNNFYLTKDKDKDKNEYKLIKK